MRSKRMFAVGAVIATLSLAGTACAAPEDEGEQQRQEDVAEPRLEPAVLLVQREHLERQRDGQRQHQVPDERPVLVRQRRRLSSRRTPPSAPYEKTSDDPLTVKYTVNDDTKWSDGTPVDAADMLLVWAAQSGNLNTITADKVKTDEATGLPKNTKGKVYFDSSSIGPRAWSPRPRRSATTASP